MAPPYDRIYKFGVFRLVPREGLLLRNDTPVPLSIKAFATLVFLVERHGHLVQKSELLDEIWKDTCVEEGAISRCVWSLRNALGDTSKEGFIQTIPRRGYRFVYPVSVETDHSGAFRLSAADERELAETLMPPDQVIHAGSGNGDHAEADGLWRSAQTTGLYEEPVGNLDFSRSAVIAYCAAGVLVVVVVGYVYFYSTFVLALKPNDPVSTPTHPEYKQLTFDRGTVWSARFVPGSNAIYYNASINGGAVDIYSLQTPSTESLSMNVPNTSLLSVSSKGETAILLNKEYLYQFIHRGVLARIPVGGTVYKRIAEDVQEADWSPDGEQLAVIRWSPNSNRLEYPIDNVLAETSGYFSFPRVSPDARSIAFFDHDIRWDNRGYVSIIGTDGASRLRSEEWNGLEGLAWKGDEVWFSASKNGEAFSVYALSMDGKVRNVERGPVNLILNDIGPNDLVLLSRAFQQTDVFISNSSNVSSELSWMHIIGIGGFALDGSSFIFTHFGEGSGKNYSTYLRKTDGSAAVRLGEGRALALSPDGRFAIAKLSMPESLVVLPTGTGEQFSLASANVVRYSRAEWFQDSERIIFTGNEHGKPTRSFEQSLKGGHPKPITPEGIHGTLVSPDSRRLVVNDPDGRKLLFSFSTGELKEINGLETNEDIIRWDVDGTHLYVNEPMGLPIKIFQLNPETGRRRLTREILPINRNGLIGKMYVFITPEGKTVLYGLRRYLMDMYSVAGLK